MNFFIQNEEVLISIILLLIIFTFIFPTFWKVTKK